MNKSIVFAKRNIKEILRAPTSWIFGMAMPIGIFVIMQIIVKSLSSDAAANVPMFGVSYFTCGVVVFGASFLTMFCVLLISKDKAESFLTRLYASPMRSADYIVGYAIAMLPLLFLQVVMTFAVALIFGLEFSANIFLAMLLSAVSSLMFIAIGILFGCCLSEKAGPPICSAVVQVAALFSGMWFDLSAIGGGFETFCRVLPFANAYDLIRYALMGEYSKIILPLGIVLAYTLLFAVLAAVVFKRKMQEN